jgi:hypothetical protein
MSLPAVRSRGAKLVYIVWVVCSFDVIGLGISKLRAHDRGPPDGWTGATGGLGLGGATGPAWSLFGVDPRLESACEAELFPIPGLACPDPTHGAGVAAFPPRR